MFVIAHTKACSQKAEQIASKLSDTQMVAIEDAIQDPQMLGDFDNIGLVYEQQGRAVPSCVISFIHDVLGSYDLSDLQYMFNICICDAKPQHSLKIVEKLCAKVGCAPSLNVTLGAHQDVAEVCSRIENGDILLAKGSLGTMFFMKFHKIR